MKINSLDSCMIRKNYEGKLCFQRFLGAGFGWKTIRYLTPDEIEEFKKNNKSEG